MTRRKNKARRRRKLPQGKEYRYTVITVPQAEAWSRSLRSTAEVNASQARGIKQLLAMRIRSGTGGRLQRDEHIYIHGREPGTAPLGQDWRYEAVAEIVQAAVAMRRVIPWHMANPVQKLGNALAEQLAQIAHLGGKRAREIHGRGLVLLHFLSQHEGSQVLDWRDRWRRAELAAAVQQGDALVQRQRLREARAAVEDPSYPMWKWYAEGDDVRGHPSSLWTVS